MSSQIVFYRLSKAYIVGHIGMNSWADIEAHSYILHTPSTYLIQGTFLYTAKLKKTITGKLTHVEQIKHDTGLYYTCVSNVYLAPIYTL